MLKSTLILALFSTSVGFAHAGDIAKGKELVEKNNCAACHGAGLKAQWHLLTLRLRVSIKTIFTSP